MHPQDEAMLNDISQWDNDYKPQHAILPGLEALQNGDYDFEIESAILARTPSTNETILRVALKVGSGLLVERAYFFKTQQSANQLGMDLCLMGFDCHGRRAFSQEFRDVLPLLKGARFRGRKSSRVGKDNKDYHDLLVLTPAGRTASKPVAPPTAAVAEPAPVYNGEVPF